MGNIEIDNIILKIYEEQKNTARKMDNFEKNIGKGLAELKENVFRLEKRIVGVEGKVIGLEGKVDSLEGKVDSLEGKVNNLGEKVINLEKEILDLKQRVYKMELLVAEIPSMKKEIRRLGERIAVIEKEHGEKIQILLDVVSGNINKNEKLEKRIKKDEKILEKQSGEIYYLREKVESA